MHKINRLLINICSENLELSKEFYTTLFDFKVDFDSDWFVHLISKDNLLELGIISKTHDIVPEEFQNSPQGFYVTFVVDDADAVFEKAKSAKFNVFQEPSDTFYGQRRLLLRDPDGALVDVSSPIAGFEFG